MADRTNEDNRKNRRWPADLKVDYRVEGNFVTDYSHNLSRRGLFIGTSQPLAVGEMLRIRLPRPDGEGPFAFDGVVRWHRLVREAGERPAGMGIEFVELTEENQQFIRLLIEKISGGEAK